MLVAGLTRFSELWRSQKGRLVSKRLEGALGRTIRCESTAGASWDILLQSKSVEMTPSRKERAPHAHIRMCAPDWSRVLNGELHVMAIILAGRAAFPKDQRRLLMQFSMLLQTTVLTAGAVK
jgi:hypothetical protein